MWGQLSCLLSSASCNPTPTSEVSRNPPYWPLQLGLHSLPRWSWPASQACLSVSLSSLGGEAEGLASVSTHTLPPQPLPVSPIPYQTFPDRGNSLSRQPHPPIVNPERGSGHCTTVCLPPTCMLLGRGAGARRASPVVLPSLSFEWPWKP